MKYEANDYELSKQVSWDNLNSLKDRGLADRDLTLTKGDLEEVILAIERRHKQHSSYLNDSEVKSQGDKEGSPKKEGEGPAEKQEEAEKVDEELLRDMCLLSNSVHHTNLHRNAAGELEKLANDPALKGHLKEVAETAEHGFHGDEQGMSGAGGKPRVKEEQKLPPNYAEIDLYNENEAIIFEGELMKFKPGYTGTFVSRYIQVTETAIRVYRNRAFALSQGHRPLLAIPVEAFLKVEKVNFDLKIIEKNKARFQDYTDNQFEIFLKDDFIDYYVNLEMDRVNSSPQRIPKVKRETVPQPAEFTSVLGVSTLAVPKTRVSAAGASPFKVRELDGKTHVMDQAEMHERFL